MLPIWSAALDPHVLAVRAVPDAGSGTATPFVAADFDVRSVEAGDREHVLVGRAGTWVRFDVDGTLSAGPVSLGFVLEHGPRLAAQIDALRRFDGMAARRVHRYRPGRAPRSSLIALHAWDAREAGHSLREIADALLGPGDWPGDGEHRKSRTRRLVASGERLVGGGPEAVFRG